MKAILWLFIRCILFLPLVAIHLALSILSSGSGNANWGIEQSISATGNALFGKDKDE